MCLKKKIESLANEIHFLKTISQKEFLFTKLTRIISVRDISSSSFKLKSCILSPLIMQLF